VAELGPPRADASLHRTLRRQLDRLGVDPSTPPGADGWARFLARVDAAYRDADDDRYMQERAIEVSSQEMAALYAELRERELIHRSILENAADGIITADASGVVESFNAAAEAMFGWDSQEIVGTSVFTLVPDRLVARVHAEFVARVQAMPNSNRTRTVDMTARRRDGSHFPVQLAVSDCLIGERRTMIAVVRDTSAFRELEAALQHQAHHDTLTGLANRAQFVRQLGRALDEAAQAERRVGVLFIDLDRFKVVNDSLGHEAGDRLLVEAAQRIQHAVRVGDLVARLGGDEFVALCPGVGSRADVIAVAERICSALAEPFALGVHEAVVTASVGIALAERDQSPEELVRSADLAMYRAKTAGRARFALFDHDMQRWADERLSTETELRRALHQRELALAYQPIVSLQTGRPIAAEALLRWHRPGLPPLTPGDFGAVAEETGLIVPIGAWVLDEAARQAQRWHRAGRPLPVAVNFSAREVAHSELGQAVAAALADNELPPELLLIELTETTMLADSDSSATVMAELEALGVRISIDDFGTGYSSLSYLRRIPAHVLKIDRSFVLDVDRDPTSRAIVGAVVSMGHALGLRVVAEGVERAAQRDTLAELGCDAAQGYLFGAPAPARALRIDGLGRGDDGPAGHVAARRG